MKLHLDLTRRTNLILHTVFKKGLFQGIYLHHDKNIQRSCFVINTTYQSLTCLNENKNETVKIK